MKRFITSGTILVAVLLLVGQGCPSQPTKIDSKEKSGAMEKKDSVVMEEKKGDGTVMEKKDEGVMMEKKEGGMMTDGEVTLKAEVLGEKQVKFEWESDVKMGEDDRFVLVRDEMPNPMHDGKNFWWKQYYTVREAVWLSLPTGTMHVRLCVLKNDACVKYSNDVEVEVK